MKVSSLALLVLLASFGCRIAFAYDVDVFDVLLLHNDEASFPDSSFSNHPVMNHGVQLDTTNKIIGAGSSGFQGGSFDGQQYFSGDYLSLPDSADWDFETGDFTIDFWFNPQNVNSRAPMIYQGTDNNNFWRLEWDRWAPEGPKLAFELRVGGNFIFLHRMDGILPAEDAWYHIAEVRNGNNWYMFLDGVMIGSVMSSIVMPDFVGDLELGRVPLIAGEYTYGNGNLDEVRISKGIARWTSDFHPNVVPEPTTALLLASSLLSVAIFRRKQ